MTTNPISEMTTEQLTKLAQTADQAHASVNDAAQKARTAAQKKVEAALSEAEAAQAELARRRDAEAQRIQDRRRAFAHHLLNAGGIERLAEENRADLKAAQEALIAALEADPVMVATARYLSIARRSEAIRSLLHEAAVALGQELPAGLANYRAPSGADFDTHHRRVLDRLAITYADEWAETMQDTAQASINGDDAALDKYVPTAAERHAENEAARLAALAEFKAGENVERVVTYPDVPGSPFLHYRVIQWRDSYTGQTVPDAAPDAGPGPEGILAGLHHWVPVHEATAEDVAAAVEAETISIRSAEFYGLPLPSTHQG